MAYINTITRRDFLQRSLLGGAGLGLTALTTMPPLVRRALAEGSIGLNGKKLLFIFLRGGNDGINSVIPVGDPAYYNYGTVQAPQNTRTSTAIQSDPGTDYSLSGLDCDFSPSGAGATFGYTRAIRLGNGFAALHPSLKFLAPVYNAGDLAVLHRIGYPQQSRSHFDSQNYWENGQPADNVSKEGIFYRTLIESGLAGTAPLTGVSVQTALPLLLRGSNAAMTNLTDPLRYDLLGVPNPTGDLKANAALANAQTAPFPDKRERNFLSLQYQNLLGTLSIFAGINFTDANPGTGGDGNTFVDNLNTDDDVPYYLFPTRAQKNGGAYLNGRTNDTNKYVVDSNAYSYFSSLKAAALVLNHTDTIIAGTEMGGFDTHDTQGGATGAHANLQRRIAWTLYGLQKYFQIYGRDGTNPSPGAKASWSDVVVVTLTEFGRTTIENTSAGTDHAEAGVMFAAGGAIKGRGKSGATSGVFGCHPNDSVPWITGPPNQAGSVDGTLFGVSDRYLKRSIDYRSVLGRIIRQHLGATQNQLNRIIPGYANEGQEHLLSGGTVAAPIETRISVPIIGEPDFLV